MPKPLTPVEVTPRYGRWLALVFVVSLLVVFPNVGSDGVGYYAYARSLLIDGDLHFENEWVAGGLINPGEALTYTATGHVGNGWAVGASMLWAPFIVLAHVVTLMLNGLGVSLAPDGYSWPYMASLAASSALFGFLGLYLSFLLAREYFHERWAFWGTLGVWLASSLPVYMYYHPSYSHAASAFITTLFLTFWIRARPAPTVRQQVTLGLLSGLMLNVYYPNVVFLLLPLSDALLRYREAYRSRKNEWAYLGPLAGGDTLYALALVTAFLPTLFTRYILYGHPLESGYVPVAAWNWTSPAFAQVLFSSNHGLFTWTPILLPATLGLIEVRRRAPALAHRLLLVFAAFYYLIAAYPFWHGASSFGNRFFVSLTPLFVLGLAAAFDWLEKKRAPRIALATAAVAVALLGAWNVGLFIQWATGKMPDQGPVSWRQVAYNQVVTVPASFGRHLISYTRKRGAILNVTHPATGRRGTDSMVPQARDSTR